MLSNILLVVGGGLLTITLIGHWACLKEWKANKTGYRIDNVAGTIEVAKIQKNITFSYGIGLGLIALGLTGVLGNDWWEIGVISVCGAMSFGAFLESRKPFPLGERSFLEDIRCNHNFLYAYAEKVSGITESTASERQSADPKTFKRTYDASDEKTQFDSKQKYGELRPDYDEVSEINRENEKEFRTSHRRKEKTVDEINDDLFQASQQDASEGGEEVSGESFSGSSKKRKTIDEINDQLQADYREEQENNNERISEKPKQKKNKGFEDLDEDIPF